MKRRLEDAGRTLMMLPMPKDGMPAGNRAAWPNVQQGFWDVMGLADNASVKERMTALAMQRNAPIMRASGVAITRLDEVLGWLLMIERPHYRKAVMARMLIHPVSQRPIYSWKQIALTLGTTKTAARHWQARGIHEIVQKLAEAA